MTATVITTPQPIELEELPGPDTTKVPIDQPSSEVPDALNWTPLRKWTVTAALSASGFNRILVSTIMAPALPTIGRDLHLTNVQTTAAMGAFVLATAVSPLIAGPMSETLGRAPVLHTTNILFFVFNLVCGFAHNGASLIAFRLIAGFWAGAIYPLSSAVMGDLWPPERRGFTLAIYLFVPLLGAAVGPIIGGFVNQYSTWRWIFWSTSAVQAITVITCLIWFDETNKAVLAKQTTAPRGLKRFRLPLPLLRQAIVLPYKQLLFHRSVQLQAALSGFGYGILYLVLSTFSSLFTSQYGETTAISGLHYIALCLGEIIGSQVGGPLMDALARRAKKMRKSDGFEPEHHLPILLPGTACAVVGFLLYGWAADRRVPWQVVDLGVLILSLGLQMTGQGLQAYNMDSYPESRASTSAAVQVFRSLGAFALPLAGPKMYKTLGYGWANTMLAGIYFVGYAYAGGFLWKKGAALRPV